jgi:hypothetical protein
MNATVAKVSHELMVQFALSDCENALERIDAALTQLKNNKLTDKDPEIICLNNLKTDISGLAVPLQETPSLVTPDHLTAVERRSNIALQYIGFLI